MVLCNFYVISLKASTSIQAFLSLLRKHGVNPITQARILRWMILPTQLSAAELLSRNIHWDVLIALKPSASLPDEAKQGIEAIWTVACGVSSRVLSEYGSLTTELMNPAQGAVPPVRLPIPSSTADSQNLELSPELSSWISGLPPSLADHPVTMLNLLAFNPGKKEQYITYGSEFSSRVGKQYGGRVKIAARVVVGEDGKGEGWDEIAYVHYPTVKHFAAMSASKEYQEVNQKYRLGALKDTFILCTMEVDERGDLLGGKGVRGKL